MTSFVKSEEEHKDSYKRWGFDRLQHSQLRRMQFQIDLQSQQRNHRLSMAAWLHGRWWEISEQERRAQLHNQKLLKDFQRAQDTLDDMVARTEAMNTIRVEYEKYLEENFPQWQQKLKNKRLSEQSKRVQQQLKDYIQEMEGPEHRSGITAHHFSSISADPPQPTTSDTLLNSHQTEKDTNQHAPRCYQNDHLPHLPPTSLTRFPHFNIQKHCKNFQNMQVLNHDLPPYFSLPFYSHHQSNSPVQQNLLSIDHMWENSWAGSRQVPTAHFTPAGASLPQRPVVNPMAWGMMDMPGPCKERIQFSETNGEKITKEMLNPSKESSQRLEERMKGKECDRSSELDCKPVRLSIEHEDSSEGSAVSSEVEVKTMASEIKDRRKKRSNGIQMYSTANGKGSQGSSTTSHAPLSTSDCQSDTKMIKKHQKTSRTASQNTSKSSIIRENNVDVVTQDEEEDEQEESRSQGMPPSSVGSEKKDGTERLSNSTEKEHTDGDDNSPDLIVGEEEKSDREGGDKGEDKQRTGEKEEAGLDDEAQVDNKEYPSDGEDTEGEQCKRQQTFSKKAESNSQDIPKLDTEVEEGEETKGEEEMENLSQDEEEARKPQEIAFKSVRKDENEREEEESDRKLVKLVEQYGVSDEAG
ncbi:ABC transporter F family member 4 [Xyrauchen texanus]|uniref:ABC transporter F family member 4 n=1 Tax=Xyrauchen texanus TaxID=154827 RepID=UPI002242440C|nr:ABC transporter F family member 4 [Xyrauchen texanus]